MYSLPDIAEKGALYDVRTLVEQGADVNAQDHAGFTALMRAAKRGDTEIVRFLLKHGADVNARSRRGLTALMFAAEHVHLPIVRRLLQHGAEINTEDDTGTTALYRAYGKKNAGEVIRLLLESGADKTVLPYYRRPDQGIPRPLGAEHLAILEQARSDLRHEDVRVREHGVAALWFTGAPEAAEGLLLALEDRRNENVRIWAVRALARLQIEERAQPLCTLLRADPSARVRCECAHALRGLKSREVVSALIGALSDPHHQVVEAVCATLGRSGDPSAAIPLRRLLRAYWWMAVSIWWPVRYKACEALVRLKAVDVSVVTVLARLVAHPYARNFDKPRYDFWPNEELDGERIYSTPHDLLPEARRLAERKS